MVRSHIRIHDLVVGFVWNFRHWPVERIDPRVAYQNIDRAELRVGLAHQFFKLLFVSDIAGDGSGSAVATLGVDLITGDFTLIKLAA